MGVKFVIDSGSDVTQEIAKELDVKVLPLKVQFGEEEFLDGVTMSHEEFFRHLIETDVMPKTSQVPPYEYEEAFRELTKDGDEVVCLTISAPLSGCYQSATIAAADFEGKVFIVDTANVCIGEMILLERGIELREEGKSAKEIAEILEQEKKEVKILAMLDTLEYLKKGGRISAAAAIAGGVLSIKPVVSVDENGLVGVVGKARGSKAGNNKVTELIKACGGIDFERPYRLAYSGLSRAMLDQYIKDHAVIYEEYDTPETIQVETIGCAIGTHIGPNAICVAFFQKK